MKKNKEDFILLLEGLSFIKMTANQNKSDYKQYQKGP